MFDFGARKGNFHIAVSIDESNGDNSVVITMKDEEGVEHTVTGTIVID